MTDLQALPSPRPFPPERVAAVRDMLESSVDNQSGRRRWKSRGFLLTVGASVVLSTGVAVAYVAFAPATDHSRVRCYTEPRLGDRNTYRGTDAGMATSADGTVAAIDAIDLCTALWRAGIIAAGQPHAELPDSGSHPVPPLTACRLPDGVAGVFPGTAELCRQLGLPGLAPG